MEKMLFKSIISNYWHKDFIKVFYLASSFFSFLNFAEGLKENKREMIFLFAAGYNT